MEATVFFKNIEMATLVCHNLLLALVDKNGHQKGHVKGYQAGEHFE